MSERLEVTVHGCRVAGLQLRITALPTSIIIAIILMLDRECCARARPCVEPSAATVRPISLATFPVRQRRNPQDMCRPPGCRSSPSNRK
jgi:hypothetical protein